MCKYVYLHCIRSVKDCIRRLTEIICRIDPCGSRLTEKFFGQEVLAVNQVKDPNIFSLM